MCVYHWAPINVFLLTLDEKITDCYTADTQYKMMFTRARLILPEQMTFQLDIKKSLLSSIDWV